MSLTRRHHATRRPRLRAATIMLGMAAVLSTASAPLHAGSADGPRWMAASELAASHAAIRLASRDVPGGRLLELTFPASASATSVSGAEAARRLAGRLLDASVRGNAAVTGAAGAADTELVIAHEDGSQTRTGIRGIVGAAFSPTGAWLAGVDGVGRLWQIDPATGAASPIANGPFGGSLAFAADGTLLLAALSSVEAPYASQLVRLDPTSGHARVLWDAPGFVFSGRELSDGSIAAVVHPLGAGVAVLRLTSGGSHQLAQLGSRAIDVSVSATGAQIAYTVVGDGVYLLDRAHGLSRRLGDGQLPRLAANGASVLVLRGPRTVLLGPDGTVQTELGPTVAWAACSGCRP